ncbi:hypothetical protein DFH06DRAFT_628064 [Mycena polygramma]|nr:hypothetical protein DFH06DRAFT_628064 [Mycena polygramma]
MFFAELNSTEEEEEEDVSERFEMYARPPPVDLSDDAVAIQYCDELSAARDLAQLHQLHPGLCYDLDLTPPPSNPLPGARILPHFSHSTVSLRLARALQSGPDKNSQVWTAVAEFAGAQTTFVLEIIQPSMCCHPLVDEPWCRKYEYTFPKDFAHGEAWAYNRLEHKQGLGIPYFYRLHTITTPSGERAWVLVFEYIPGQTLSAYSQSPTRSLADSCDLIKLSLGALTEFMADGWCHSDPAPRNILVTGSPGARRVVLIDLYAAVHCIAADAETLRPERRRNMFQGIYDALGDPTGDIKQWVTQNKVDLGFVDLQ